ncbi:CvpA family protein [Derxia gummosa]|uniref:CvpA family protein n=1 Tax=Derxia gummosa DSM 723 TaxID=1121388 RepID=A0A8B6X6F6_9BURK|nr:CvpA family protein [Derxia gummosa]
MTSIDWLIAGALCLSAVIGVWRGLVRELFALLGWIAAIVAVLIAGTSIAGWLPADWNPGVRLLIGGLVIFVGVMIATSLLGRLLAGALKAAGLGPVDRLLGFGFGLLRGLLVVAVMIFVLGHTPVSGSAAWTGSVLLPYVMTVLGWFRDVVPDDAAPIWQV